MTSVDFMLTAGTRAVVHQVVRGFALVPLVVLTSQCRSDEDPARQIGGSSGGASSASGGFAGVSAGTDQSAAGSAGGGRNGGRYCQATTAVQPTALFRCPADYCDAITAAIRQSDTGAPISSGAAVRAGRCAAPNDSFNSVYLGTGVGSTECFYRLGVFVGRVDWEDSWVYVAGCSVFLGPVVYGEFPESALKQYPTTCGGLTNYRPLSNPSDGSAGAPGVIDGVAGGASGGVAGTATGTSGGAAGAAGAPVLGSCYLAATATCGPC